MLPFWIRGEVALNGCCPFILVDQGFQVPVVYVTVLPVRCLVELQVVSEFHIGSCFFCYWYVELLTILLVARRCLVYACDIVLEGGSRSSKKLCVDAEMGCLEGCPPTCRQQE